MPLAPITEDLWELVHEARLPAGVRFPVRMTVWRLPGRQLALCSAVPIDDAVAAELAALGEVAHVIAPNRLHTRWFAAATARYPEARPWPPGALGDASPWPELDLIPIRGAPRIDETVFFHRPSRTLVCADLVFHVTRPANLRSRLVLRLVGAGGGRLAASRSWRFLVSDRAAAAASLARVLAWPVERIVMGHGEIIATDGAARLRDARLARLAGRRALSAGG